MPAPGVPQLPSSQFGLASIEQGGDLVPAVATNAGVVPLEALLGGDVPSSVRGLLEDWDGWCDRIAAALDSASVPWIEGDVVYGPPLPNPANLFLAGANYHDHVAEMHRYAGDMMKNEDAASAAPEVFHFMVPTSSLVGTGHDIVRPKGADNLDWEVELAVVIGKKADAVKAEDALAYVAGYGVANDVSVRGPITMHPVFGVRFIVAKGQATLTPMGPVIVPARFVSDPQSLALTTHINGEVRQDSTTAQMIFSVAQQIEVISSRTPLLVGDLILTGTPAGTAVAYGAYLSDGDEITVSVEGLGSSTNKVVPTPS